MINAALIATFNETYKGLQIQWSYRFNLIGELLTIGFVFIGIAFFMGNGQLNSEMLSSAYLGYIIWFYTLTAISNMAWGLREEMQAGTMEQMYMSPAPVALILLGRTLANVVITTLMITVISVPLTLLLHIQVPFHWAGLPVFGLTLAGLYGFGYIVGGAVLIFKQVETFANLIQNLLLFLNGSFLPVNRLPGWLELLAKTLPSTQGIIVLRRVLLDHQSLATVWQDGSLIWLTIHSAIYFFGGLLFFRFCERIAKRRGSLGQY